MSKSRDILPNSGHGRSGAAPLRSEHGFELLRIYGE
jgi:hypothetical protein